MTVIYFFFNSSYQKHLFSYLSKTDKINYVEKEKSSYYRIKKKNDNLNGDYAVIIQTKKVNI